MNVVVAAQEIAGLHVLKALARSSHRVVGVLTGPPPKSESLQGTNLWDLAQGMGFASWPAEAVKDRAWAQFLGAQNVDVLLNVHSLYIIDPAVLAVPRLGAYNLHPGPLPRYAGLNSVSWAIYRGEKTHGVTIHKMEAGIDTGAIVFQELFPIEEQDTAFTLSFKCTQKGVALMLKLLEGLAASPDGLPVVPQDFACRQYFGAQVPRHGRISWVAPAGDIVNFVRACDYSPFRSPWGHPTTSLGGEEVSVIKAERTGARSDSQPGIVGQVNAMGAQVAAGDEWVLVKKLKRGNKSFDPASLMQFGDRLN
jgi:methionyl-tRNA formyltransferase